MSYRPATGQSVHDHVIDVVAAAQDEHDIFINPGQEHNASVQIGRETVFPDLLLCRPPTTIISHLIEVETEDSVTETESSQWATYARGPGRFWLLVPATRLATAQAICRRRGIRASFGRWWVADRRVRFDWLQPAQ